MSETVADEKIDLRGVLCPINFVKTKLFARLILLRQN